ncbi:BTAD domain-containing putative transcriptional regulator [Streptomyces xiamenensis]|uniref:BTAD domain-containing putative transcriptional regulator n=1 Tax=Streptomyces xiamenensis TaxID=408015 RepID=UPI0035E0D046
MRAGADPGELRFRLLGPLEVLRGGAPVRLGGFHQRAVLAYLLLRPNRVTATSELIAALWRGPAPASARKMVQNAVWRLRGRLLDTDPAGAPQTSDAADARGPAAPVALWSRPPGYQLNVPPHALDLHRFHTLAAEGRDRMREGAVATASLRWREALALWRGPMLSDLVETGVRWPDLEAAQTARLDVLEKYFDAELALGRHDSVLPELRAITRAEPRGEPFTGQLMLALHRGGRRSEALDVYAAIRTELAEELGLEPGRRLHELHRAILVGDPALDLDPARPPGGAHTALAPTLVRGRPEPAAPAAPAAERSGAPPVPPPAPPAPVRECREVTAALINISFPAGDDDGDLERVDAESAALEAVIGEEAGRFGGTVTSRIGSSWLVVLGAGRARGDEPLRAVQLALAIRQRLRWGRHPERRPRIRAAIDTGEAVVQHRPQDAVPPAVTSAVFDRAHALLPLVPLDEVWVGETTREQTCSALDCRPARVSSAAWTVRGMRGSDLDTGEKVPLLERTESLRTLAALLDGVPGADGPHAALVVAGAGLGKTALLTACERLASERDMPRRPRPLLAHLAPRTVDDSPLFTVATELCAACGIEIEDPPGTARHKLWTVIERVADDADEAARLFALLLIVIGHVPDHERTVPADEVMTAWHTLLERLATERRVIVLIDDLHTADDAVLRLVDRAVDPAGRPGRRLTVIAAARPELFRRRPAWAPAAGGTATAPRLVPLAPAPLSDPAVAELVHALLAASTFPDVEAEPEAAGPARELAEAVTALSCGNPLIAAEFVRMALRRPGSPALSRDPRTTLIPGRVRRMLGAELDALPAGLARVVQDAAAIGDDIRADTLAALRRHPTEATAEALGELAARGILAPRAPAPDGTARFGFRRPLLREVAYARLPRGVRAARHAALAAHTGQAGPPPALELLRLHSVMERWRR